MCVWVFFFFFLRSAKSMETAAIAWRLTLYYRHLFNQYSQTVSSVAIYWQWNGDLYAIIFL